MDEPKVITPPAETPTEDWKAKYEAIAPKAQRLDELEPQYKKLQTELNKQRERFITRDDFTAFEDRIAKALDATRDSDEEEEPKRKPKPSEVIRLAREAAPKPKEPEVAPEVVAFATVASRICKENGWDENSPQYRTANSKEPVDGLTYLYQEAAKSAATKAAEAAELKHKQAIKDAGGTSLAGGPSAASLDFAALRQKFIQDPYRYGAEYRKALAERT